MLTDDSIMPFGKYIDTKMANVPASYLKYRYDTDICYGEVKEYIKENLDIITKQVKEEWGR